ncbi:MAG TPA: hypothetical protein VK186_11125 [Candidatus Deferrimicrobium sp.]|nr:hypothetical protein [Candidatus Deferrimicrobium sp.]
MRKIIIICLAVILVVSFTFQLQAQAQVKKHHKLIKPMQAHNPGVSFNNPADEQLKRDKYLWAKNLKTQKHSRCKSSAVSTGVDTPKAVSIEIVENSDHWQADSYGDLVWTARCHNSGTTGAIYIRIDIDVYNSSGTLLGSDYNYVWGGSNVKLASDGTFTNALRANEDGFFRIWTDISYAQADSLVYSISYETPVFYLANASLDFTALYYANDSGYLNFYGDVQNESTSYVTHHTIVAMAALDPTGTFVEDVDWNYVNGDPYDSPTSKSAIYPQTIRPFDITFRFALYSESDGDYMASFEWEEDLAGPDVEYPFGEFETPGNYTTVSSSVAVTGWALDDTCVASVKIYREAGGNLVYIGDATFVDGARPDIAQAYPEYPLNTRAGWGYMMLTNFLPNDGNGYFVLHAIATDVYGDSYDLGTISIYCDNANAVNPFGAIDTPTSGGDASGNQFLNIGWVLTPPPNTVPKNGSTIGVYVDGIKKGNATYNLYREDIANLFPGYKNSNGAMATFKLNTIPYANGMHTIYWIAYDNAGNGDGIGSRYFNIQNAMDSKTGLQYKTAAPQPLKPTPALIAAIPTEAQANPVLFKKGYRDDMPPQDAVMGLQGDHRVNIRQMERVELQLPNVYAGYLADGGNYKPLPVGSTLDTDKGMFYWHPGPAFRGEFRLVFIVKGPGGALLKKNITIAIDTN